MTKKKTEPAAGEDVDVAAPPGIEPFAVVNPPGVAPGELINASWGNAVVNVIGNVASLPVGSGTGAIANHLFDNKTAAANAQASAGNAQASADAAQGTANSATGLANTAQGTANATAARLVGFQTRRGSVVVTAAGGVGTVTFSSGFPAGSSPTVVCCNGDDGSQTVIQPWLPSTVTANGFQFAARKITDAALYDGGVRVNYIATIGEVPG